MQCILYNKSLRYVITHRPNGPAYCSVSAVELLLSTPFLLSSRLGEAEVRDERGKFFKEMLKSSDNN